MILVQAPRAPFGFSVLLLALLAPGSWAQETQDPEDLPEGREQFLGRTIARTMHSSGANWLLRERREQEESASVLRRWLNIQAGQRVCDFGCGNGYHTLPMAKAVGAEGRVFAVDLQAEMLRLLGVRLAAENVENTTPVLSTLQDPRLPEGELDLILMVDVYHELSHPVRVMEHLRGALKADGRMVLIEYRGEDSAVPIKVLHRMDRAQVVREMAAHGMRFVESFEELPWQHALVFERAPEPGIRHQPREVALGFLRALERRDAMGLGPFMSSKVGLGGDLTLSRTELIGGVGLSQGEAPKLLGPQLELRAGKDGTILAGPLLRPGFFSPQSVLDDSKVPASGPAGDLVLGQDEQGAWRVQAWRPQRTLARSGSTPRIPRPFFAMNTGTGQGKGTPSEQASMVCDLGFDGIGWGIWRAPEVRRICEQRGADLWSIYCVLRLDEGDSGKYRQLQKAMRGLAGGPGMIWLGLEHPSTKDESDNGEQAARELLAPLLQLAQETGVEIALYPHTGFWIANTQDALDLCGLVNHPSLGTCFNLCHFLSQHEGSDPTALLGRSQPHLMSVTINGADRDAEGWDRLIQPLDSGDYDLGGLLDSLDRLGWGGPIGLQAWGIQLPPREHLASSRAAWGLLQEK